MPERLYVFVDANVIFSASYKSLSRFLELWNMPAIVVMTSLYAADEARRNCTSKEHSQRLEALLGQTTMVSDAPPEVSPIEITLPEKDRPVLASAIDAGADFLITGDRRHFARWMNRPIRTRLGTLTIMEPGRFLERLKTIH